MRDIGAEREVAVVRILEFGVLRKTNIRLCFHFNPRYRDMGLHLNPRYRDVGLLWIVCGSYDLAKAWFCQLYIVSVIG